MGSQHSDGTVKIDTLKSNSTRTPIALVTLITLITLTGLKADIDESNSS